LGAYRAFTRPHVVSSAATDGSEHMHVALGLTIAVAPQPYTRLDPQSTISIRPEGEFGSGRTGYGQQN
jgi:hypothetical protein